MAARRALNLALDYLQLTVGALCIALSVAIFLAPNNVVAGGLTGIAQLARTLFGTPIGLVMLLLNVPLFALGWRYLGGVTFGARTLYATALLGVAIDAFTPLAARFAVDDPLLYVFYGGVLDGAGLGLVFRSRGTTGGTDIVAQFLHRWRGIRPGQALLVLNAAIFARAGWTYGAIPVLYALLVAYISGRVVDLVLEGTAYARSAIIISAHTSAIRQAVLEELGRGVTVLEGEGGYTASQRPVLLCVVARTEESHLRALIQRLDPDAFVVITEAAEVLGEGFRPLARRS